MEDVTGKHPVTLAVVQMDCALGDVEGNLASIAHYSRAAAELGADLVVFPGCATTGYFVAERLTELAEPPDGHSSRRLSEIARTNRIHLAIGLIITEEGRFYDAQTLHGPDGRLLAFIDRRKRPFGQTPHQPDLIVANFTELAATLA